MSNFEKDVINRLGRIETKLDADFRDLHGHENELGLIQEHRNLEDEVKEIKTTYKTWGTILSVFIVVSTILGTGIALLNYISNKF